MTDHIHGAGCSCEVCATRSAYADRKLISRIARVFRSGDEAGYRSIKWGGTAYTMPLPLASAFMEVSDDYVAGLRLLLQAVSEKAVAERHAYEVALEMLRGGDVDGAIAHLEEVLRV